MGQVHRRSVGMERLRVRRLSDISPAKTELTRYFSGQGSRILIGPGAPRTGD